MELPRFDRQAWLCIIVAIVVLVPRSLLIVQKHSESIDADYHLRHGLAVLLGNRHLFAMSSTDAPLGQMILAFPLAVTGNVPSKPIHVENWPRTVSVPGETAPTTQRAELERTLRRGILYGNAWSPQALLRLLAVWKSLLFVPALVVIFQWSRGIYGLASAWLTQALILIDPNIAAHVPAIALDSF